VLLDQRVRELDKALISDARLIGERDEYIRSLETQLEIERERAQASDWRLGVLLERMQSQHAEGEAHMQVVNAELAAQHAELHLLRNSLRRQVRLLARTTRSALRARVARLRQRSGRNSSEGLVAVNHREATVLSRDLVGRVMDEAWYRQTHGLGGSANPIAHWSDLGIENGYALSPSHDALVGHQHADSLTADQGRDLEWALSRPGHAACGISASFTAETAKSDAYDLLTLDLWDTLIERTRPADAAKLATARRMALGVETANTLCPWDLMEQRVSIEATIAEQHPGGEYELSDVIRRQFAELGIGVGSGVVEDLVALEVADEIAWTHPREEVLNAIVDAQMPVAIVSDFYLGESHLRQIVDERLGDLGSVRVFSSCTEGVSKRVDGQLLRKVRNEFGVRPDRHLHVGDNPYSDIEQQVLTGGSAISVSVSSMFPGPGQFSRRHTSEMTMAFLARLETDARLRWRENRDENRDAEAAYVAGSRHAFLAVALVAGALEHSWVNGVETVHYLSREGQFLEHVHQAIESILRPPGRHAVNAVVLEASRRSTFPATLRLPLAESLGYMWAQYRSQSPRAMLVSAGLDPTLYGVELSAVGLGLDDDIEDIARNPAIREFLEMPNVVSDFVREGQRRRDAMRAYMRARTSLSEEFVCVDIGWRGTIQDNICRALGITRSTGFYMVTFPFLTPQAIGIEKVAVGIDGARGDDCSFIHPPAALELPWTPETPSCVNYDVNDDGVGCAVSDTRVENASVLRAHYQQGLLDSAPTVAHWMVGHGYTSSMVRDEVASELRRIWETPPQGLADIWFESEHDDTFGALNAEHFGKMGPDESWFDRPISDTVDEYAALSHWEKGYRKWRPVHALLAIEVLVRDRD
jgi:FMN phosphatase YigB (HAD superfamily)